MFLENETLFNVYYSQPFPVPSRNAYQRTFIGAEIVVEKGRSKTMWALSTCSNLT